VNGYPGGLASAEHARKRSGGVAEAPPRPPGGRQAVFGFPFGGMEPLAIGHRPNSADIW